MATRRARAVTIELGTQVSSAAVAHDARGLLRLAETR
jgi:hypothetical protein